MVPVLIKYILIFLEDKDNPDYEGYIYATVIVILLLLRMIFNSVSDYYSFYLGVLSKNILNCGILYYY